MSVVDSGRGFENLNFTREGSLIKGGRKSDVRIRN